MNKRWLLPLYSGLFLAGCTMGLKPEGSPPRPESVTGILFRAPAENLSDTGRGLDSAKLAETISRNLGAWGYPVTADAKAGYSHVMEPKVSEVEGKSTPPGFSFSAGNSDPRALEFQRAEVVTVTCTLRGVERSHENAYLKQSFVADEVMKKGARARAEKALFDAHVNHVGTACFNLLSALKVKRSKPDPQHVPGTTSSTWFPEVRIEVRDKPAAPAPLKNPAADTPKNGSASASAETAAPASGMTESEPPSVQTEIKEGETRKQMIIHNQGSPIILEFGYERK